MAASRLARFAARRHPRRFAAQALRFGQIELAALWMDADNQKSALERIDAALARIERAAANRPAGDSALASRHEALRDEVAQAIQQIDAIIGEASE